MKYLISTLSFLIIFSASKCQGVDSLFNINELSNLTVMLIQPISNEIGTATIIKHRNKFYLLTANHVALKMRNNAKVVFRTENDVPAFIDLIRFNDGKDLKWIHHKTADLCLLELKAFNNDIQKRLEATFFPSELINDARQAPPNDFAFIYLGFPVLDANLEHFSPLRFSCNLASGLITQSRKDNGEKCNFFYLDKPGLQGCSGSGVYISVEASSFLSIGKTLLVGIVHGTEGDNTGGKLAMITPSYYIFDLFNQL